MSAVPESDGERTVERLAIGGVSSIPSSRNPSGFEPYFAPGRELRPDEINLLRADMTLVHNYSTNSPAADLSRTFTRLQELHAQALNAWRPDEPQPKVAHLDGLTNLLQALGEQALKVHNAAQDQTPTAAAEELAGRRFTLGSSRSGVPPAPSLYVSIPAITSTTDVSALAQEVTDIANAAWFQTLLDNESELRSAILRVRALVAPVLDGAPVLFRLSEDGSVPQTGPSYENIDLAACRLCIQHIQTARVFKNVQTSVDPLADPSTTTPVSSDPDGDAPQPQPEQDGPPSATPVSSDPDGNAPQPKSEQGEAIDQDASPPHHPFDASLIDLTLMAQSLLDSAMQFQMNWSRALSNADQVDPRFTTMLSAFGSVIARLAEHSTTLLTQYEIDSRLPAFPTPLSVMADVLTTADLERVHLGRTLATVQIVHDLTLTIRSFHTATLANAANTSAPQAFWNDGAFHNFLLRFDYLIQALLQEGTARSALINERIQPTLNLRLPDQQAAGMAQLTMTVQATSAASIYASLANSSIRIGDYIAAIFHSRNFLNMQVREHGTLARQLEQRGVVSETADQYSTVADLVERYVVNPTYDISRIVHLATSALKLVDALRSAPNVSAGEANG